MININRNKKMQNCRVLFFWPFSQSLSLALACYLVLPFREVMCRSQPSGVGKHVWLSTNIMQQEKSKKVNYNWVLLMEARTLSATSTGPSSRLNHTI